MLIAFDCALLDGQSAALGARLNNRKEYGYNKR